MTRRKSRRPRRTRICPAQGRAPLHRTVLPAARASGRYPTRTHVRRPFGPPLLYFAAVLAVRSVRIILLTSGAKEIRTPDLLYAIWRQHVHPRPSVQVTILMCACAATSVHVLAVLPCCAASLPCPGAPVAVEMKSDLRQPCTRLQGRAARRTAHPIKQASEARAPALLSLSHSGHDRAHVRAQFSLPATGSC
jgi:hypothetical protein